MQTASTVNEKRPFFFFICGNGNVLTLVTVAHFYKFTKQQIMQMRKCQVCLNIAACHMQQEQAMIFRERWGVSGLGCVFRSICFYFLRMDVLPTCMSVYHVCVLCSQNSEEHIRSTRTGVTDESNPLC